MSRHLLTRRSFGTLAAALGAPLLAAGRAATLACVQHARRAAPGDKRCLVIVLGGGVRPADVFEGPDAPACLKTLVAGGTYFPLVKSAGIEPHHAIAGLLCGVTDDGSTPTHAASPTIFEYARKDLSLAASDTWLVTSAGLDPADLACSQHADYGRFFSPASIAPDRLLGTEVQIAIRALRARASAGKNEADALRAALSLFDPGRSLPSVDSRWDPAATVALQDFLARESLAPGNEGEPASSDARALRAAAALVDGVKPRLMVVVLSGGRTAETGRRHFAAVLEAWNGALALLLQRIRDDDNLRQTTTIAIATDVGRNRKPSKDDALRRDDGSADLSRGALILHGTAIKPAQVIKSLVNAIDLAPTLGAILGVKCPHAKGRILRPALA